MSGYKTLPDPPPPHPTRTLLSHTHTYTWKCVDAEGWLFITVCFVGFINIHEGDATSLCFVSRSKPHVISVMRVCHKLRWGPYDPMGHWMPCDMISHSLWQMYDEWTRRRMVQTKTCYVLLCKIVVLVWTTQGTAAVTTSLIFSRQSLSGKEKKYNAINTKERNRI